MRRLLISMLVAVAAYPAAAVGGGALLFALSAHTHDRRLEAAMTGAFVFGPVTAIVAFLIAYVRTGRRVRNRPG
jgi:hypothetical protein